MKPRYESSCCGVRIIRSDFFIYCSKCYKTCDVIDDNDDPAEQERHERRMMRKQLVKILNKRKR